MRMEISMSYIMGTLCSFEKSNIVKYCVTDQLVSLCYGNDL